MGKLDLLGYSLAVPALLAAAFTSLYVISGNIDNQRKVLIERKNLGTKVLEKAAGNKIFSLEEKIKLARDLGCNAIIDEQEILNYNFNKITTMYNKFELENGKEKCYFDDNQLESYLKN